MVAKGYAISATVTDIQPYSSSSSSSSGSNNSQPPPAGSFTVTVTGPCNLWALNALKARNSKVINAYDVMVTAAWLRAGGRRPQAAEVELFDSGLIERWTV
jgi:hypothetical protein